MLFDKHLITIRNQKSNLCSKPRTIIVSVRERLEKRGRWATSPESVPERPSLVRSRAMTLWWHVTPGTVRCGGVPRRKRWWSGVGDGSMRGWERLSLHALHQSRSIYAPIFFSHQIFIKLYRTVQTIEPWHGPEGGADRIRHHLITLPSCLFHFLLNFFNTMLTKKQHYKLIPLAHVHELYIWKKKKKKQEYDWMRSNLHFYQSFKHRTITFM